MFHVNVVYECVGAGCLTIIPSVMKRMAPPRMWRRKKVGGRPRSLAGLQQLNTLPWPGEVGILSFRVNAVVTKAHTHTNTHIYTCFTLATVLSRAWAWVFGKQTWTVAKARQQSFIVHQCEYCCWHWELPGHKHTKTHKEAIVNQVGSQYFLLADSVCDCPVLNVESTPSNLALHLNLILFKQKNATVFRLT